MNNRNLVLSKLTYCKYRCKIAIMESFGQRVEELLKWIKNTQDEKILPSTHSYISPNIAVKDMKDFGRGIRAASPIKKKEMLLRIPHSFLLNFNTVVRHISRYNDSIKLQEAYYTSIYVPYGEIQEDHYTKIYSRLTMEEMLGLSSFQLLSFYICFEKQRGSSSFWKPFIDMLPETSDFDLAPLVWKVLKVDHYEELLKLLPNSTKRHMDKIYDRFQTDYNVVKDLISIKLKEISDNERSNDLTDAIRHLVPIELYLWSWMCINSRCLYMEIPQSKNAADNFTMAPYVDFLNHSCDDQCGLKIDGTGFQVYTTCSYNPDEQLFLSYGPHSNEFLLCEYGFTLPENKWNDLDVSDYILPLMKPQQIEFLNDYSYYGEYTINEESGMSFRTEVALAVLQELIPEESRKLLALVNGYNDGSVYERNSKTLLKKILERVIHDCDTKRKLEYNDDNCSITQNRKKSIGILYNNKKAIAQKTILDID